MISDSQVALTAQVMQAMSNLRMAAISQGSASPPDRIEIMPGTLAITWETTPEGDAQTEPGRYVLDTAPAPGG
ncbi:hypothetical protein [Streptomyces enissocaesilis]|uniref:Regulatory protein n=1 Tax=Streptomyces enissocaesilis TaxID=332589 RepID=A0ABP6K4Q0_9ACTN